MNSSAPPSLYLFVIILGLAIQWTASLLAVPASSPTLGMGMIWLAVIFTLGYAVRVAYRRGFEAAAMAHRTPQPQEPAAPQAPE